jgi:hypothetical protein
MAPGFGSLRYGTLVVLLLAAAVAGAHPEDEFCVPGQDGLDPALCAALAELDSADAVASTELLDAAGQPRDGWSTFGLYVMIGIGHILPGGFDHILFVLALFLSSGRTRDLIIQISTFTIAHTVTLGLAAAGYLSPNPSFVEPVIAASIAFVAIENLVIEGMPWCRPVVVFIFGLVHGLGFAGFFGELGLPKEQFLAGLVGFNVGVEIGQLGVLTLAFCSVWFIRQGLRRAGRIDQYRPRVTRPASLAIALTGAWWALERSLAALA